MGPCANVSRVDALTNHQSSKRASVALTDLNNLRDRTSPKSSKTENRNHKASKSGFGIYADDSFRKQHSKRTLCARRFLTAPARVLFHRYQITRVLLLTTLPHKRTIRSRSRTLF